MVGPGGPVPAPDSLSEAPWDEAPRSRGHLLQVPAGLATFVRLTGGPSRLSLSPGGERTAGARLGEAGVDTPSPQRLPEARLCAQELEGNGLLSGPL